MTFWNFTRSPASVQLLLTFGRAHRLTTAQLLADTRLTEAQLGDAAVSIEPGQELTVIANLVRALPHMPDLGLKVGLSYHASAYGVLGLGIMSSATGLDALQLARRYLPLTYAYVSILHRADQSDHTLLFEAPSTLGSAVRRFVVQRAMGATARIWADIAGQDAELSIIRLRDVLAPTSSSHASSKVLNAPIHWGSTEDLLSISRRSLERPLPMGNSTTVAMCLRMCEDLLKHRRSRLRTVDLVREYLAALPDDRTPRISEIATILNTSERTLKRWLRNDDSSYRELMNESRCAKASRLMNDRSNSLTDVATRLGFSDLSSFSQAYKRWTGVAPSYSDDRKAD